MIRYVLAVVLTVSILGLSFVALDHASAVNGEYTVQSEIVSVDRAATSLLEDEQVPPLDQPGPQRTVEVDLPNEGFAEEPVETLVFERVADTNQTVVRYRFDGRAENVEFIDAPISHEGSDTLAMNGTTDTETLVLELTSDESGQPVIAVEVE